MKRQQRQQLPGTMRKRVHNGKTTYYARLQLRGQREQCVALGADLQAARRKFADVQRQWLAQNPAMSEPASVAAVAALWLERRGHTAAADVVPGDLLPEGPVSPLDNRRAVC